MKRGWLTIAVVSVLFGAYRLYIALVGPITTPVIAAGPSVVPQAAPTIGPLAIVGRSARNHLVDEDWAATAKYQLQRGESTFLYFHEQRRIDDEKQNKIRVSPFAMVWVDPRREDKAAYTLSCKSAVMEFQRKVQLGMSDPGRLIAGQLDGTVRITGPDGLEIVGQGFSFREENHRLYSDNPVQFAFGPEPGGFEQVRGQAGGVDIGLKIATESLLGNDMPLVGGLQKVQLRKNVVLDLVMDDHGRPAPVQLRCKTQFVYDVDQRLATFVDDVRVRRATHEAGAPEQYDWLECAHLQLAFDEPLKAAHSQLAAGEPTPDAVQPVSGTTERSDRDEDLGISLDLEFRSLRAIGREPDAEGRGGELKVGSQENDLAARMEDLMYDVKTRTVEMRSTTGDVEARYRHDEMSCPTIRLQHDADDKIQTAECIGAGRVRRRNPQTGDVEVESSWTEHLLLTPDEESELDVLQIVGDGRVVQPLQKTGIVADTLKVWLDGEAMQSGGGDLSAAAAQSGVLPLKRVEAISNVALVSPQLQLETQRLETEFVSGTVAETSHPLASTQQNPSEAGGPSSDDPPPVVVAAEAVATQLVVDPVTRKTDVLLLNAMRGVTISRPRSDGEGGDASRDDPFSITAEDLELRNEDGSHVLRLLGSPARIWHPEAEIEGAELYFDRGRNRAAVKGKGSLTTWVSSDLQGRPLEVRDDLVVRWEDQMTFDGQRADFFGNVRTTLADSNVLCQRMRVTLDRKLDLADQQPGGAQLELDKIACRDGVVVEYHEWDGTTLIGIRKLGVAEFDFERATGEVTALGPGWIADWRRGGQRHRMRLDPESEEAATTTSDEFPWEYTRVKFAGRMKGNERDRYVTLSDRVEVMHGPVKATFDTVDREDFVLETHQAKNSIWIGSDTLEVRLVPGEDGGPDTINVLANGNAELQAKVMGARADSITFEEAKEMFTLKGRGSDAYLWHQDKPGGDIREMPAKTITLVPSRHEITVDGARRILGSP